ncbi:hypothetical protein TWF718_010470 [Orbilia javanica]|uniref:ubiquitinyl hydrolase 1 n=1 Tax=Orbilia javanica TaxID=47235 RepID=A0AAN8MYD6_9PEZI
MAEDYDLTFLIENIVLPPNVPQEEPNDLQAKNFQLLKFVDKVVRDHASLYSDESNIEFLDNAHGILKRMVDIHNPHHNFRTQIQAAILNLEPGEAFGLYVTGQNAGITFRRLGSSLQLETFEVTPLPEAPLGCKGRLKCTYPGPATAIPWEIASNTFFLRELSQFLQHMTFEQSGAETLSKSSNGSNEVSETRSSFDPRFIVELFTGIMRGLGKEVTPRSITKSIRDECNWNNAEIPWRRSGMWLVIRVVLQTTLSETQYKFLILEIVRALLKRAVDRDYESYGISCASKKLARRCRKVEHLELPPRLLGRITSTIERASILLQERWSAIRKDSTREVTWDRELGTAANLDKNTDISLPNSMPWIKNRLDEYKNPSPVSSEVTDPSEIGRCLSSHRFPDLRGGPEAAKAISLVDFEIWIKNYLDEWCGRPENTCAIVIKTLSSKIPEYYVQAAQAYNGHNIFDTSIMVLTIIEMWVCLDKSTCLELPLLKDYLPEIPQDLLEPLLFVRKSEMKRINQVEQYLANRHSKAQLRSRPSIFDAEARLESFACQHYNADEGLQTLKRDIEAQATRDRDAKIKELQASNARYSELMEKSNKQASCEYSYPSDGGPPYHYSYCKKCTWKREAESMSIDVHEWPLPKNTTKAHCTIFELRPPRSFVLWRDTTYYIITNVCATTASEKCEAKEAYRLDEWKDLRQNLQHYPERPLQVTWASITKPIGSRSHYKKRKFPAVETDVILKNSGKFRLYDSENSEWIQSRHTTCTIKPLCTSTIAGAPYDKLGYAVNDVIHTHNETIARQFECPASLTLREYDAFTTLRSGRFLQWHNILTELHRRDLTFNKDPVYLLILHATCHVGKVKTTGNWQRDSHSTLAEEAFSKKLLDALRKSLSILKDNWEQAIALKSLVLLAQRLVSCGHPSVTLGTLLFLKDARRVCDPWVASIQEKIRTTENEKQLKDLRFWLLRIAGIQCSTFDVDENFFPEIFEASIDLAEYLVSQNIIYDNSLGIFRGLPHDLELLLERNRRFSVVVEPFIQKRLQNGDGKGVLTSTVERILPGKTSDRGTWKQLPSPADRWWVFRSVGSAERAVVVVHLNVLEGTLLVNGKPNGRLPVEYFTHPTYKALLGNMILDVICSEKPGIAYETKNQYHDLKLYFQLKEGNLIIRKDNLDQSQLAEFIPLERFRGDIPTPILENGTQWLDLANQKVTFYQGPKWWQAPDGGEDWILQVSHGDRQRQVMSRNADRLLDLDRDIHTLITNLLGTIEERDYIISTISKDSVINFSLPRYKLQFYINRSNLIECRTLRGWTIHQNQDIGTFFGLKSYLKLQLDDKPSAQECILVPYGNIVAGQAKSGHTSVCIKMPKSSRTYTVYQIDRVLNRLVDDGTLKAQFTRLYLHGLCSGLLPDPLTGRTGVAEALDGLRNSASFSFQTLQETDADILKLIAGLTPKRTFYPSHLKVSQQIHWQSLPPWVQNDSFYPLVLDILDDWSGRQFLFEGSTGYQLDHGSVDLLDRAKYHNSIFEQGDMHANDRTRHSSPYRLRHTPNNIEADTCDMSATIFRWSNSNELQIDLWESFKNLAELAGIDGGFTPTYTLETYDYNAIKKWSDLYRWCQDCRKEDRFSLLLIFCSWLYRGTADKKILKSLVSIAASRAFKDIEIPAHCRFKPYIGLYVERSFVEDVFDSSSVPFENSDYSSSYCSAVSRSYDESDYGYKCRRKQAYEWELAQQKSRATDSIMDQYKVHFPKNPSGPCNLLRITTAMESIRSRFQICFENRELFEYCKLLRQRLCGFWKTEIPTSRFDISTIKQSTDTEQSEMKGSYSVTLEDLLQGRKAPDIRRDQTTNEFFAGLQGKVVTKPNYTGSSVIPIAQNLKSSTEPFAQKYGNDLLESIKALEQSRPLGCFESPGDLGEEMLRNNEQVTRYLRGLLKTLNGALSARTNVDHLFAMAGLWPTSTKLDFLQQLRLKERRELSVEWKRRIILFGEAITWLQRSNRLCHFASKGATQEIETEVNAFEKERWNAEDYVDWLLFEIDSEMLIRPIQAKIGLEMMREGGNSNAVMQLNMGEGKSAVIMPIVIAALADTTKLVRPVVLKPLSTQMFQILAQRLSGLCDRRIYFLPFHRGLKITPEHIQKIRKLYERCKLNGDILLTLPEHQLSFKLMGLEKLLRGDHSFADVLIETQEWLDQETRDVLDESDEILHIRYQLIYTMGQQHSLDGDRDRWTLIQDFLDYLQEQAKVWGGRNPSAIEVLVPGEARYPVIRVIDQETGREMLKDMAKNICSNNTDKMPTISSKLRLMNDDIRSKVFQFISEPMIPLDLQQTVLDKCKHLEIQLLVLRGLIANGVLLFILREKRYRVDYGLDIKRSNLAVPYRAKDRPAVKAEFGHPEVVLTLTCLSYYYGGLDNSNLKSCFELLLKTDDPDLTYEEWTLWNRRDAEVSDTLSKLQGLNLLDQDQLTKDIYPSFKYNKHVVDFFLSELIFPREAKGFPHKLSTSGWDIAQEKRHNTTGFSGTNDNQYLLPTSIKQLSLPQQLHTNSLVLMNILQEENNSVIQLHKDGKRLHAVGMLEEIAGLQPKVRVLLDVGAQILELTNFEVAREWLRQDKSEDIHGAVFFGDDDEILVMKRDETVEPFVSSNLAKQLDQALVYLDEAHTRGTDLKLPINTRAAVTLGPSLAKDKFVQGCMRMRKLGNGHSLTFLAPPDIYSHIQKQSGKNAIGVSDVLSWTMQESCHQIHHGFAIWADQGLQYLKRDLGWKAFKSRGDIGALRSAVEEPESRTLFEMYGVSDGSPKLDNEVRNTAAGNEIIRRLDVFRATVTNSVRIQEEQEREVDLEKEKERNIERPKPAEPMKHKLARELIRLVREGWFDVASTIFQMPFTIFGETSCRDDLEMDAWGYQSSQFVTKDFSETVERAGVTNMDDYLRPVRWILEFYRDEEPHLVFISPYEANELMLDIKASSFVKLHCYAPKISRGMPTFEYFDVCPVEQPSYTHPRPQLGLHSRIRLNLFAGQLFFEHEQYYRDLCAYLSLNYDSRAGSGDTATDGWVPRTNLEGDALPFLRSPIPFLKGTTKMRRKGQGFTSTHLGGLLDSRILGQADFDSQYSR